MAGVKEGVCHNHSSRATSITRLHQANVEQIIKEFSGHKSNAVRTYKHSNDQMKWDNCKIIRGKGSITDAKHEVLPISDADMSDFDPKPMPIRTPMKRKNEVTSSQIESSDSKCICDFIASVTSAKKYKKIKVNLEFIESE